MSEEQPAFRVWDADAVKQLRTHLGLSQRQLAERLGIRQQTVSEWETGLYLPRGASVTLLRMVSEEAGPAYGSLPDEKTRKPDL